MSEEDDLTVSATSGEVLFLDLATTAVDMTQPRGENVRDGKNWSCNIRFVPFGWRLPRKTKKAVAKDERDRTPRERRRVARRMRRFL